MTRKKSDKVTQAVLDRCAYPTASIRATVRANALYEAYLLRPQAGELGEKARVVNLLNDLRHTLKDGLARWLKERGAPGVAYQATRKTVDATALLHIDFDLVYEWIMEARTAALAAGERKAA